LAAFSLNLARTKAFGTGAASVVMQHSKRSYQALDYALLSST